MALAFRNISARYTAETAGYSAAVQKISQETRSFGQQAVAAGQAADKSLDQATRGAVAYTEVVKAASRTEAEAAQANVAAAAKRRQSLEALRAEYIKLAATAEQGSAQQLAALRLQDTATKRLGATTAAVSAEREAASSATLLQSKLEGLAGKNALVAKGLGEVTTAATGSKLSFAGMSGTTMVAAGALLAVGVGAAEGVKKMMSLAGETKALQRVTGASAEEASVFGFQLKMVGVNSADAAPSLFRFSKNIEEHAEKFNSAGVAIERYDNGTVNVLGTLDNMRERLKKTGDSTERSAIMFDLLGKGALTLAPFLGLSTERLKELEDQAEATGHKIGQDTVDQSTKLRIAMRSVNAEVEGVQLSMAEGLLPVLVQLADGFVAAAKGAELLATPLGGLGGVVDTGIHTIPVLGSALDLLQGHYKDAAVNATGLGHVVGRLTGYFDDGAKSAADHVAELDKERIAAGGLQPFVEALAFSQEGAALEGDKLIEASQKLQVKMNDLAAPIGMTGDQLLTWAGSAEEAERRAKSVASAMESTRKAFSGDFSFTATFSGTNLAKEARDLAQAQKDVAEGTATANSETEIQNRLLERIPDHVRGIQAWAEVLGVVPEPMDRARDALSSLLEKAGDLSPVQKKIVNFYQDSLLEASAFSENIRTAIRQGYDPQLISELLQKGPKEAGPILQEMVNEHSGKLKDFVNAGQDALNDLSFQMTETARLTHIAVVSESDQMNTDLSSALAIMQLNSGEGGRLTGEALATQLGLKVADVQRIAKEFGITLAEGVNPVLSGVGAATIDISNFSRGPESGAPIGAYIGNMALGGFRDPEERLPRDARFQPPGTLVQWAEPETEGEYFIPRANDGRRPRAVSVLAKAADDFGYDMVRRFATGGFILPSDVPTPPSFEGYGDKVGYTGQSSSQHIYDLVVEFVKAHPPRPAGGGGSGSGYGFQALIDYLNQRGVDHTVTSTVRPGAITNAGNRSRHADGLAADFAGDMSKIFDTFMEVQSSMYELIHSPKGFSLKAGQRVGAYAVADHYDHVHAATYSGPGEGPGLPTGAGEGAIGGGGDARAIGQAMAAERGWVGNEWDALEKLWTRESDWDPNSVNSSSGAYGIPQALGHGHPFELGDVRAQVQWGMDYIAGRYGLPSEALAHSYAYNWYNQGGFHDKGGSADLHAAIMDQGGTLWPGANLIWNGTGAPEHVPAPGASSATTITVGEIVVKGGDNPRATALEVRKVLVDLVHDGGKVFARS